MEFYGYYSMTHVSVIAYFYVFDEKDGVWIPATTRYST